jgi:lipopolysaccharide export system permease protein
MLAAGISKFRIVKPLLIAAIVVSLLGVANRELVIPQVRDELARDTKDLGGNESREVEARFDSHTDILLGGEKTVAAQQRIIKPAFVLPAPLARYGKQLVADNAYYLPATVEHPGGYLFDKVSAPRKLDRLASLTLDDQPVVITPKDAPWLKPGQAFVVSQLSFRLLASGSAWRNYASTPELIAELGSPSTDLGPDVRVAVHARLLQPVMDGTLLMLGLPLMLSRRRWSVFYSFSVCLGVAIAFTVVTLACQSLGDLSLLRPTLAAWMPILVFLPLAVAMGHTLRT